MNEYDGFVTHTSATTSAYVQVGPQRIQRKRTKGWRMPDGAVYVGRPSQWGNPFIVEPFMGGWAVDGPDGHLDVYETRGAAIARAVEEFRALSPADVSPLRGRDLVCWCPLTVPCHADLLLRWANA
jgi:hypothetical protein